MLNLFYSESYWGHTDKMNGPKKVVYNLRESLEQENIPYAVNEERYKYNFLIQYDHDKLVPVFGFGGIYNGSTSHCFPL